jgi:glycerol-3-phosphate O-acyltransferase
VEFGEPISVRKQLASVETNYVENLKDRKHFTEELGFTVVYSLIDKLVIMPTSMVAAIILMHRKGIQED